ncbi:hypothetical protein [Pontibacter sp. G13]|uniref:hypothetical protein n=1 Tax=Pontibacter sp. G13 TaxID=3074898 RepID=UPI00288A6775|nr:hypothetical protein [Pontibacter sp. G13]WNJ20326.1 hypothetical protein RJD25_07585 [Pontibacter sp. G13]
MNSISQLRFYPKSLMSILLLLAVLPMQAQVEVSKKNVSIQSGWEPGKSYLFELSHNEREDQKSASLVIRYQIEIMSMLPSKYQAVLHVEVQQGLENSAAEILAAIPIEMSLGKTGGVNVDRIDDLNAQFLTGLEGLEDRSEEIQTLIEQMETEEESPILKYLNFLGHINPQHPNPYVIHREKPKPVEKSEVSIQDVKMPMLEATSFLPIGNRKSPDSYESMDSNYLDQKAYQKVFKEAIRSKIAEEFEEENPKLDEIDLELNFFIKMISRFDAKTGIIQFAQISKHIGMLNSGYSSTLRISRVNPENAVQ